MKKPIEPFATQDRRQAPRVVPGDILRVTRAVPVKPLAIKSVLNVSVEGVAIETEPTVEVAIGERLSCHFVDERPPVLVEVVGIEHFDDRRVLRCRCLMGNLAGCGGDAA